MEKWTEVGRHSFQGKGQLMMENKTVFTENMRLYQKDDQWFFEISLEPYVQAIVYQLRSYQNYQAIFENDDIHFPNQLILQRHSDNKFSTILQNKLEEKASLTDEQMEFLQKRNVVTPERIIRNLVKKES